MADEAELSDERAIFLRLIDSEGWKLFTSKWEKLVSDCQGILESPDCANRDYVAGLCAGYKRLLAYPSKRIVDIDNKLNKKEPKWDGAMRY